MKYEGRKILVLKKIGNGFIIYLESDNYDKDEYFIPYSVAEKEFVIS